MTRSLRLFYVQVTLIIAFSAGFGGYLLHAISPEVMVAQAIERETER